MVMPLRCLKLVGCLACRAEEGRDWLIGGMTKFDLVAGHPDRVAVVADARQHGAKVVTFHPPRPEHLGAADLFSEQPAAGLIGFTPVRVVSQHVTDKARGYLGA